MLTLSQLVAHPQAASGAVHLRNAVPDLSKLLVEDHLCHRTECQDHFMPLYEAGHGASTRVALLSLVRTFPGDVNEARHPFDLDDPVVEGAVSGEGLFPSQIQLLRLHGLLADGQTVVFQGRALQGKVPSADSVDVLVPWLIGLPVALLAGLVALAGLRLLQQQV